LKQQKLWTEFSIVGSRRDSKNHTALAYSLVTKTRTNGTERARDNKDQNKNKRNRNNKSNKENMILKTAAPMDGIFNYRIKT